ncbi:MAG: phytanoyl-CoA dioxygenase family protein [Fimbriiglobus sp.]
MTAHLDRDGFAVLPDPLPAEIVDALTAAAEPLLAALPAGPRGGVRDLLSVMPAARDFARSPILRDIVEPVLGAGCVAVGGILFDKADGRNWKVPYHQDVTIRLREKIERDGFGPWWEKAGVPHTWPPAAVLERMLAVRIHLDDCGPDNGPLRVLPGSHRDGILSGDQIDARRDRGTEVTCCVPRGGALLVRPLLLHASSVALAPARRRVLHIEYAANGALPPGFAWWEAWGRATG